MCTKKEGEDKPNKKPAMRALQAFGLLDKMNRYIGKVEVDW